jgi:hypothetical protein
LAAARHLLADYFIMVWWGGYNHLWCRTALGRACCMTASVASGKHGVPSCVVSEVDIVSNVFWNKSFQNGEKFEIENTSWTISLHQKKYKTKSKSFNIQIWDWRINSNTV